MQTVRRSGGWKRTVEEPRTVVWVRLLRVVVVVVRGASDPGSVTLVCKHRRLIVTVNPRPRQCPTGLTSSGRGTWGSRGQRYVREWTEYGRRVSSEHHVDHQTFWSFCCSVFLFVSDCSDVPVIRSLSRCDEASSRVSVCRDASLSTPTPPGCRSLRPRRTVYFTPELECLRFS